MSDIEDSHIIHEKNQLPREFDVLYNIEQRQASRKATGYCLLADVKVIKAMGGFIWQKCLSLRFQKINFFSEFLSQKEHNIRAKDWFLTLMVDLMKQLKKSLFLRLFFLLICIGTNAPHVFAQEVVKTYFERQGGLREQYQIDSQTKKKIGPYIAYYINGHIKIQGTYFQGLQQGEWVYFYENGKLKMKADIKIDSLGNETAVQQFFYETQKLRMKGMTVKGKREGKWEFFYENGYKKQEGHYIQGIQVGTWKYYSEFGKQNGEAVFKNGEGNFVQYYPTKSDSTKVIFAKGRMIDGKSDGEWFYYYENGTTKSKGKYNKGLRTGLWITYHPNGQVAAQGRYQKGKKTGRWRYYYDNGTMSAEGNQLNDKQDGFWKLYHKSGTYKGDGNFQNGTGEYKEYHPNGNLKISGQIKDGKSEGKWLYYYENGDLEGECIFENGKGEFIGFYKGGKTRMKGIIKDGKNVGLWTLYSAKGKVMGYYTTLYENGEAIRKTVDKKGHINENIPTIIPDYIYKKRRNRYYTPQINEFRALIFAVGPVSPILGNFPFSTEYYIQERLGLELIISYRRNPFYLSSENISDNKIYQRGIEISLRQKFYSPDKKMGMLYFAHAIEYGQINHLNNINTNGSQTVSLEEMRIAYWASIGDRLMKFAGSPGLTIDAYIGLGLGFRMFSKGFDDPDTDHLFRNVNKSNLFIPFKISVNIGYAFGVKRKQKRKKI